MSQLEEIKARLEVANLPPLEVWVTENLRWADIVPQGAADHTERVARCADDDHAELFASAPTDMAKLLAALEAVQRVAQQHVEHPDDGWAAGWNAALTTVWADLYEALA